ncbi:MAG: dual specificity protein phosphatase family protein [Chloroflexota bacterium]
MNFSPITDDLFIGTTPSVRGYDRLRGLGVRLVINMRWSTRPQPDPHNPPLDFLWLRTFDTFLLPIPIHLLVRGARTALTTIRDGGKVYAHCAYGRHRGVAMGTCILIVQGMTPDEAMRLVKSRRPVADPDIFYIRSRILKFAREWQTSS